MQVVINLEVNNNFSLTQDFIQIEFIELWKIIIFYINEIVLQVERLKLLTDNVDDVGQVKSLNNIEYVKLLVPEDKEQTPLEPTQPSHVLSLHSLRALPLLEQCRQLLKDGKT